MKVYIMTDMEGVAGVLNFEDWCTPSSRYYDLAKEFLTMEVNAAVEGFFEAGATEVLVADGHGAGGIAPHLIDERVELARHWPQGRPHPFSLDTSFDVAASVGQHAKAGTEYAHLAHTGSFDYLNETINGLSIGEFGSMVLCASELGVRTIFAAGDEAFTREAAALVPGVETVSVKRGTMPGSGDELPAGAYSRRNLAAIHVPPARARRLIREGARKALERAASEEFGIVTLKPPYERVSTIRPSDTRPLSTGRTTHPSSIIELFNTPLKFEAAEASC